MGPDASFVLHQRNGKFGSSRVSCATWVDRSNRALLNGGLSLPFLCENQVPVFLIGFRHRFLPLASAIAGRRVDIFRAAFSLGWSCIRSALVLWQSIVFWSGFGFNFPIVASHGAS